MDHSTEEIKKREQLIKELLGEELGEQCCERLKNKCSEMVKNKETNARKIDILRLKLSVVGNQMQLECSTNATFANDFDIEEILQETAEKFKTTAEEQMPKISEKLAASPEFHLFALADRFFKDVFGKEN